MEMLLPILLVDVLNPVLLAFLIYTAGTRRGVLNSCAGLLGHTLAYFSAGLALLWGFDSIASVLANPGVIDYALSMALGLLLLWVAYLASQPDRTKQSAQPEAAPPGLLGAFVSGAVVNFIGLPFALPYFAAVDQIIKADVAGSGSIMLLAAYNLAYATPFLLVPILTAAMGEGSRRILQRVNAWVERGSAVLMPIMLALLGIVLLADGLSYFVSGEGLW